MNNHFLPIINNSAMQIIKENYKKEYLPKQLDEMDYPSAGYLFDYEFHQKFGHYGELWDGQPNEYITALEIERLLEKYQVSRSAYLALYRLTGKARVKVLAGLYSEALTKLTKQK